MKMRVKLTLIKTDLYFGLILFYTIVTLTIVMVSSSNCKCSSVSSDLDKFNNYVLKRRIRAVLFPKNAQLLLTPSFSKAIIDGRPKGLLYSVEFDMYSPLPDSIEGWKPTIIINNIKKQKTTSQPLKKNFQNYTESSSDNIQEKRQSCIEDLNCYDFPIHEPEESNNLNLEWSHVPTSFSDRVFKRDSFKKSNKFKGYASNFHNKPYLEKNYKGNRNYTPHLNQKLTTPHLHLHHDNQSNRERRQILKQLQIVGKIFKFNMKECLQRAMCELTSNFRSYGESVMEDIVRIILIPSYTSHSSGRSNNFSADDSNVKCKQNFSVSCPYSVLDFLHKNMNVDIRV